MEAEECGVGAEGAPEYDRAMLPDLLRVYYRWLFPYDKYFTWLQYGDPATFSHREFSFTLQDDVYLRYQSFNSQEELEEGVRKHTPYKIDIGAIFTAKPNMRSRVIPTKFIAKRKELVFDIDMTDYDDIRTCCQDAQICQKCWKFIVVAIRIIDRALREDFGFQHRLWVYSGRRGVHCWVCDEAAIDLSPDARSAIVEYLSLVKGGEQQAQKVKLPTATPIHPSISSALEIIRPYFPKLLREQDFLGTPETWGKVLQLVPDKIARSLDEEWSCDPSMSSWDRWGRLKNELKQSKRRVTLDEIKLQFSYPRLDVNVSKGINHLLKSPLCVHPKTGRICVPIDTRNLDRFDPFAVPMVSQICAEFEKVKATGNTQKPAYMKTSLKPYMEYFNREFLFPLHGSRGRRKAKEESREV